MKRIYLLIFIFSTGCTPAKNKDIVFNKNGLGELKLGMSQSEVEKLLNEKIPMTKNHLDTVGYINEDTAKIKYQNIEVQLEFNRSYYAPNKFRMRLIGIRSSSPLCKTASGIGVGSDRSKIIAEYDDDPVYIEPGFANYFGTEEGEGKSTLTVSDDTANYYDGLDTYTIVFYLINKKVVSFELKAQLKDERD